MERKRERRWLEAWKRWIRVFYNAYIQIFIYFQAVFTGMREKNNSKVDPNTMRGCEVTSRREFRRRVRGEYVESEDEESVKMVLGGRILEGDHREAISSSMAESFT